MLLPSPTRKPRNPAAPTAGRKIFRRTCVSCHGENGSGENTTGANLRSSAVQAQTDGALFWKITTGNTTKQVCRPSQRFRKLSAGTW
jgi:mono/diheme cytochrome c family protein